MCSEQRIPMDDVAKSIERTIQEGRNALIQEQVERARKFLKLSTATRMHGTESSSRRTVQARHRNAASDASAGRFLCPSSNPA